MSSHSAVGDQDHRQDGGLIVVVSLFVCYWGMAAGSWWQATPIL